MWVVIIGIVPLICHLFNLQLKQRPLQEQLNFWTDVLIGYLAVGLFITMVGAWGELDFITSVIFSVAAVLFSKLIVGLWFRLSEWMHRLGEREGLVGELKAWVVFDIVMFIAFILMVVIW